MADVGTPIPMPVAGCGAPTTNYYSSAIPLAFGSTGTRSFASTEQGTIFYTTTAAAPTAAAITAGTATPIQ
jgi:hypothetical protein